MEEVPRVESVDDVYQYISELWKADDLSEKDNVFTDDYYFTVYNELVEGVESLELDMDVSEFERKIVQRDYSGAGVMVDNARICYRPPTVSDKPFRPESSLPRYL